MSRRCAIFMHRTMNTIYIYFLIICIWLAHGSHNRQCAMESIIHINIITLFVFTRSDRRNRHRKRQSIEKIHKIAVLFTQILYIYMATHQGYWYIKHKMRAIANSDLTLWCDLIVSSSSVNIRKYRDGSWFNEEEKIAYRSSCQWWPYIVHQGWYANLLIPFYTVLWYWIH